MSSRIGVFLATVIAAAALAVPASTAKPGMLVGIYDETQTLYGNPDKSFPILGDQLHVKALRVNLYWGGRFGVANRRPTDATDPDDPSYNWDIYDRTVRYAAQYGIQVVFSIYGTPRWANGSRAPFYAPKNERDLRNFAAAAAKRYDGASVDANGTGIPRVRRWLAWNEPNNPLFLRPQYKRVGGTWVIQSAVDYAKICNAVVTGVHSTLSGDKVACGVTAPRGNNSPSSVRGAVSPLAFLRAMKKAGAKGFDAYAHHPYYGKPSETPATPPPPTKSGGAPTAVTLGNIGDLIKEVTRLYGRKPIWITEYGYQTKPPDSIFGVSWAKQALYLKQAFTIARRNPRIEMMLWFLLYDEKNLGGWQSGLFTWNGKTKKPAFAAFQKITGG